MNILLFTRGLVHGGAERQVCLLANGLAARGHAVTVMVYHGGGALEGDLAQGPGGVRLQVVARRGRWDAAGFLWRLIRAVRAGDYDVVYSFLPLPNALLALLRPLLGRARLVWGLRGSSMTWENYADRRAAGAARLERALRRVPDLLIANSEAGRDYAMGLGYPRARLAVIENGVDGERFRFDADGRRALRAAWGIGAGDVLIGVAARLDPMKGLETFLAAAARLAPRAPHCRFVWVGAEGAAVPSAEVARLGLSEVLRFVPPRDDMPAVYSAFDLLCMPSAFGEGFSNVVAEAMACERAVVATDVGDAARMVAGEGRVVPPGDAQALAAALEAMAVPAPEESRRPGTRRAILDRFGAEALAARTEAALARLLRA